MQSFIIPNHTSTFDVSLSCVMIWWGDLLAKLHQLSLFTRQIIWNIASSEKLFKVVNAISKVVLMSLLDLSTENYSTVVDCLSQW